MIKLTFLGDIMCEGPFLEAAMKQDGGWDFDSAFSGMKALLAGSDYVVGNFETPLAGEEAGYSRTRDLYSFNTPDCFADAVRDMGVDLALTANNHCCDRGIDGLKRTLKALDDAGLRHTGTFDNPAENEPAVIQVGGERIAVIACTATTNALRTGCEPSGENVNLLQRQVSGIGRMPPHKALKTIFIRRVLGEGNYLKIRTMLGKSPKKATVDSRCDPEAMAPYLAALEELVHKARERADLVIVCPHMGGQFNRTPGRFSEYVMERLVEMGADAVVASHPHIVQKVERRKNVPCAYSLGNVSMSMSTAYIIRDDLPDYGMALHLYVDGHRIVRTTCSLLIMQETQDGYLRVRPLVDAAAEASDSERIRMLENARVVMRRIRQDSERTFSDIAEEFEL